MTLRSTRAGYSKSRAGCFTCKKRHVRCDEAKPVCGACYRLLLSCEYPLAAATRSALQNQHACQRILL
ncbi:hypothetical protein Micbo1qcDRAFT_157968, partial [Microdochium bolleyi]